MSRRIENISLCDEVINFDWFAERKFSSKFVEKWQTSNSVVLFGLEVCSFLLSKYSHRLLFLNRTIMDYDKRELDVLYQESPSHNGEEVFWGIFFLGLTLKCLSHTIVNSTKSHKWRTFLLKCFFVHINMRNLSKINVLLSRVHNKRMRCFIITDDESINIKQFLNSRENDLQPVM